MCGGGRGNKRIYWQLNKVVVYNVVRPPARAPAALSLFRFRRAVLLLVLPLRRSQILLRLGLQRLLHLPNGTRELDGELWKLQRLGETLVVRCVEDHTLVAGFRGVEVVEGLLAPGVQLIEDLGGLRHDELLIDEELEVSGAGERSVV